MTINFSEVEDKEIVLFITPADKYASTNKEILDYYTNNKDSYCIYISINTPYSVLKSRFEKDKIPVQKVFVIDAVTPVMGNLQRTCNCCFVGSPRGLTDMSILTSSLVKSIPKDKQKIWFLDSASTLLIYNEAGSVTKFLHYMINKIKEWGISGFIISLEKEMNDTVISELKQFCDKTIEVK